MTALASPPALNRRPTRERAPGETRSGIFNHGLPVGAFLLFTLVPFYWMIVFAFRQTGSTLPLPVPFTFDHLKTVWTDLGFSTYLWNSVAVALCTLLFTVVLALLTGYALARFEFRGKSPFMVVLLATQFVPGAMLLIPLFLIFKQLGLIDNLFALIISDTVFQLPLCAILMSNFLKNIPIELEEAAMIDGCSRFRAFCAVVLPLLRPAIVAVGSFAFIGAWNNFLFALMFINHNDRFTLPIGLNSAIGEYSADYGALAAGGVVAAVPVVIVFAFMQRFLVQGVSAGAVKG
ncbi:carbohydrate ABC transporter permease [Subtercola boreus]|uniref:Transporter n=1 Tax=Subtercola boreus TaxID=120213 RepID=A0A3E0WBY4_9MICO|nr:carbohydrate ABC transporter permease [Subtercola boreus]RFA22056.1 transporter [Subtercola boreus]RFA22236.1 transporter [Subtercola boreus]RFA28099.1 transporter [Subtercola boreus]